MDKFLGANLNDVRHLCERGHYDYIIVGSGMAGGVLARTLVSVYRKRVLVVERGGLLFTTHCLNTSRPHWNYHITEGSSQDNDLVFHAVKQPVQTVTADSYDYVGGPVHCLGGRSTVWGLYTPRIHTTIVEKYFPEPIRRYLLEKNKSGCCGYDEAYRLMTGDKDALQTKPYPENNNVTAATIQSYCSNLKLSTGVDFKCASMGAEFVPSNPTATVYQIPQGAFSTTDWFLDRLYNKDKLLTVLLNTEVVTVDAGPSNCVDSITVRQKSSDAEYKIVTSKAKAAILCAGAIDTAVIALRSGVQDEKQHKTSSVGKGLIDHDIWGSRFEVIVPDDGKPHVPIKLEGWWKPSIGGSDQADSLILINIAINANTFLGSASDERTPTRFYSSSGLQLNKSDFKKELGFPGPDESIDLSFGMSKDWTLPEQSGQTTMSYKDTVQVVFEFTAPLEDANAVLNMPESTPIIHIGSERDETPYLKAMQDLTLAVQAAFAPKTLPSLGPKSSPNCCKRPGLCCYRDEFLPDSYPLMRLPDSNSPMRLCSCVRLRTGSCPCRDKSSTMPPPIDSKAMPKVGKAGFGVVAHEAGTMRMESPASGKKSLPSVVDADLKVDGWKNLYVCDMSVFPVSPAANPSLTLVALAQRLGKSLAEQGDDEGSKVSTKLPTRSLKPSTQK